MNYTKVRGHYSWWLKKEGKSIGQFNFNGLTSDEEAEAYVDEIVKLEAERDALQAKLDESIARIFDILMQDDGQAYKEAEKFLDKLKGKDDED